MVSDVAVHKTDIAPSEFSILVPITVLEGHTRCPRRLHRPSPATERKTVREHHEGSRRNLPRLFSVQPLLTIGVATRIVEVGAAEGVEDGGFTITAPAPPW